MTIQQALRLLDTLRDFPDPEEGAPAANREAIDIARCVVTYGGLAGLAKNCSVAIRPDGGVIIEYMSDRKCEVSVEVSPPQEAGNE